MQKIDILVKLELVINSFIISAMAGFAKTFLLDKEESYWRVVSKLFGSICFGTLVGYLLGDIESLKNYNRLLTAAATICGKELTELIIKLIPKLFTIYYNLKTQNPLKNNGVNNPN